MPGKTLRNYGSSTPRLVLTVDLALNVENRLREAITDNVPKRERKRQRCSKKDNGRKSSENVLTNLYYTA